MSGQRQVVALTAAAEQALLDVPPPELPEPEPSQRLQAARQRERVQALSALAPALQPVFRQPARPRDGGASCRLLPEVQLRLWAPVQALRQFRGGGVWLSAVRRRALSSRAPSGHGFGQPGRHSKD